MLLYLLLIFDLARSQFIMSSEVMTVRRISEPAQYE